MKYYDNVVSEKRINIDEKDKEILKYLSLNARLPNTYIGPKIGLSKDTVKYRKERLEKEGVIQGYTSIIDISRLGHNTQHLFLKIKNIAKRDEMVQRLVAHKNVKALLEYSGKYDLEVAIATKDNQDLDNVATDIIKDQCQEYEILILSKTLLSRVLPGTIADTTRPKENKPETSHDVDRKDLVILKELSENSVQPYYVIGEKIKMSGLSVVNRINKLIESGMLKGNIPKINYFALGYTMYTLLLNVMPFDESREGALSEMMKNNDHIVWAAKGIGRYNLIIYVCVDNAMNLYQTIDDIRKLFSEELKDYETLVAYEEHKYSYFPEVVMKKQ